VDGRRRRLLGRAPAAAGRARGRRLSSHGASSIVVELDDDGELRRAEQEEQLAGPLLHLVGLGQAVVGEELPEAALGGRCVVVGGHAVESAAWRVACLSRGVPNVCRDCADSARSAVGGCGELGERQRRIEGWPE
jgi:hypothetical protein